jgi:hypothetical protein
MDVCRREKPEAYTVAAEHWAACHLLATGHAA